jgi:hypothetical protein
MAPDPSIVGCNENITLHGGDQIDSIAAKLVAANFLVNVGLIQHKDTVVHTSEFTRKL